ncbi:CorA family magnesium ion transporter [Schizosaccharomyces japonicus yFS275]|uniref:CorA family magnesium ion transporter n=1 Tax=Schizosaccharomyces japonicus (strain yFS275 / FY16936) TaxID=402676 RepID=B6K0M1_SCHJY|nr:CorA family magnesium ion transporter [Schizosaccharomyces japonicus yFS275]EEB07492.1 CorA family magnesium ion transporter [Schizosaccharomyces japonicus yFS275]
MNSSPKGSSPVDTPGAHLASAAAFTVKDTDQLSPLRSRQRLSPAVKRRDTIESSSTHSPREQNEGEDFDSGDESQPLTQKEHVLSHSLPRAFQFSRAYSESTLGDDTELSGKGPNNAFGTNPTRQSKNNDTPPRRPTWKVRGLSLQQQQLQQLHQPLLSEPLDVDADERTALLDRTHTTSERLSRTYAAAPNPYLTRTWLESHAARVSAKDVNNPPSMPTSVCPSPHDEDAHSVHSNMEHSDSNVLQKAVEDFYSHSASDKMSSHSVHNYFDEEEASSRASAHERESSPKSEDGVFTPIPGTVPTNINPEFDVLDAWAEEEILANESNVEDGDSESTSIPGRRRQRARKMSEPMLVDGRYRVRDRWANFRKHESERPFRFTFFTDELPTTIHSRNLWELPQEGQSFRELFHSGGTWWLDVYAPTADEVRLLAKCFHIHPLTVEDITMEEDREKVELFRNYYFVTFRSFNQLPSSADYLKPLNLYMVVFRDGILTFHANPTPHPPNVRRRIRQLNGYLTVDADWIAYALIDDTTDAFAPLIEKIEDEVDTIDGIILGIHHEHVREVEPQESMLKRVGECRKLIMSLLRLLANKADVVRGLAKRCNEAWQVAPRGEIALYLGDVQDHIVTMVQNLNHYEKILSRSHSNYLAQISINMTLVSNETNDVLSRLTVLGTILVPLNLVTGLWGMNTKVPGQDAPGLTWFFGILSSLIVFAVLSVIVCKRYKMI